MSDDRKTLLSWVERDQERLIEFFSKFIQAKSPNPPGDTREAMEHIKTFMDGEGLKYRIIDPHNEYPNLVASFEAPKKGRHLVLNGHIDVFPVAENDPWTYGPWSGAVADGKVWGRGSTDMKCGTTASIFTYYYLSKMREKLKGKLTLTCVSDEETFGPWGARYLMEKHPEVHGDTCLNGEPSGLHTLRFGEKGPLWLKFTVRTKGAHGAYTHMSDSASKIAGKIIADLEALTELDTPAPGNIGVILERAAGAFDKAQGKGASKIVQKVTLNIGKIDGGLKVNMVPGECNFEADIRFPVGLKKERVIAEVEKIVKRYPQAKYEEMNFNPPSWCDPDGEMVGILKKNAKELRGIDPEPIISLGGTDARLWRYLDIPAYVYGPPPRGMGSYDEYVEIDEFFHIVRTHVLSAYDYMTK